jgi:hypothetical protein
MSENANHYTKNPVSLLGALVLLGSIYKICTRFSDSMGDLLLSIPKIFLYGILEGVYDTSTGSKKSVTVSKEKWYQIISNEEKIAKPAVINNNQHKKETPIKVKRLREALKKSEAQIDPELVKNNKQKFNIFYDQYTLLKERYKRDYGANYEKLLSFSQMPLAQKIALYPKTFFDHKDPYNTSLQAGKLIIQKLPEYTNNKIFSTIRKTTISFESFSNLILGETNALIYKSGGYAGYAINLFLKPVSKYYSFKKLLSIGKDCFLMFEYFEKINRKIIKSTSSIMTIIPAIIIAFFTGILSSYLKSYDKSIDKEVLVATTNKIDKNLPTNFVTETKEFIYNIFGIYDKHINELNKNNLSYNHIEKEILSEYSKQLKKLDKLNCSVRDNNGTIKVIKEKPWKSFFELIGRGVVMRNKQNNLYLLQNCFIDPVIAASKTTVGLILSSMFKLGETIADKLLSKNKSKVRSSNHKEVCKDEIPIFQHR